jgi:hypothetical protein
MSVAQGYNFLHTNDPIDVIIPAVEKDKETLELCIESVKNYVTSLRRIIVISKNKLTDNAEWFCENDYPFNFESIGKAIYPDNEEKAKWFKNECPRKGWILQQLLKLYAPFVIPGISSNVLCVDSDVIFFKRQVFLNQSGGGIYANGREYRKPYFSHLKRLLPNLEKAYKDKSGICHHMLFQKEVLDQLFEDIKKEHNKEAWIAICQCIDHAEILKSPFSEYEIYFNYLFTYDSKAELRTLKWKNSGNLSEKTIKEYKKAGFDYVAFHAWKR